MLLPISGGSWPPWLMVASPQPSISVFMSPSLYLCVSFLLSLTKTRVIGFRAHPKFRRISSQDSQYLQRSYFQIRSRPEVLGGREFGVTLFIPLHCVSGAGDEGFSGPSSRRPGKDMAQGRDGLGNLSQAHNFPSVMSISRFLKLQTVFLLVAVVVYLFW